MGWELKSVVQMLTKNLKMTVGHGRLRGQHTLTQLVADVSIMSCSYVWGYFSDRNTFGLRTLEGEMQ